MPTVIRPGSTRLFTLAASPSLRRRVESSVRSSRAPRMIRREVNQVPQLFHFFAGLRNREEGQTMAEYGVVLAVITLLVVGAFTALSGGIKGAIDSVTAIL